MDFDELGLIGYVLSGILVGTLLSSGGLLLWVAREIALNTRANHPSGPGVSTPASRVAQARGGYAAVRVVGGVLLAYGLLAVGVTVWLALRMAGLGRP